MAHEILIVDDEPDIRHADRRASCATKATRPARPATRDAAHRRVPRAPAVAGAARCLAAGLQLDGLGILERCTREEPDVPVVMISGHGTIETAVPAIQHGAYDFIEKPFQSDRLLLVIRRALEAARLAAENAELRLRAGAEAAVTGSSPAISAVRAQIERVAPTGSRVLISGGAGAARRSWRAPSTPGRAVRKGRSSR